MNVDLDKYVRNFRIFYQKIVAGHPEQATLEKKFKFLVQNQANKWRSGLFSNSAQDSVNSVKSFLSKARSLQPKSQANKKSYDWLFETSDFSRAFIFVAIASLLQARSKEGLQMIRSHMQNQGVFTEGKFLKGVAFRKVIYSWSKIQKLFLNTFNTKPHLQLGECLNQLPNEFIDKLYDIITDERVKKLGVGQVTDDKLNKLVNIVNINLTYFQFENDHVRLLRKSGIYKKNVNIGYLPNEGIYVVAKQLPKKQRQQVEKKTLVKMSKIATDLFKMYENSDAKLRNLQCIVSAKQKALRPIGLQAPPRAGTLVRKGSLSIASSRI